jgi:hypothetical protein
MMDGAHYRKRADEVRAEADRSTFPDIRAQLASIAKQYDTLAIQADYLAGKKPANRWTQSRLQDVKKQQH